MLGFYFKLDFLKTGPIINKPGLQPVSIPGEQIVGFFQKILKRCKKWCKHSKLCFIRCGAFGTAKPVTNPLET